MNLKTERHSDFKKELRVPKGRDSQGVWDGHVYTTIFKTDNQQGATV